MQINSNEQKLLFSIKLQQLEDEIYRELYPHLFHKGFDKEMLLTKAALKKLKPEAKKLALKIHEMILTRFQHIGLEQRANLLLNNTGF